MFGLLVLTLALFVCTVGVVAFNELVAWSGVVELDRFRLL